MAPPRHGGYSLGWASRTPTARREVNASNPQVPTRRPGANTWMRGRGPLRRRKHCTICGLSSPARPRDAKVDIIMWNIGTLVAVAALVWAVVARPLT